MKKHLWLVAVTVAFLAAACGVRQAAPAADPAPITAPGSLVAATPTPTSPPLSASDEQSTDEEVEDVLRNAILFPVDDWTKTVFEKHSMPFREFRGGGPPKDGIPAIDEPKFVSVAEADE